MRRSDPNIKVWLLRCCCVQVSERPMCYIFQKQGAHHVHLGYKKNPLSPGEHVSTIASKTGTVKYAGSKSRVVAEICDAQGTCCQTSSDGRGLDNSKVVRQAGQTDVYTDTAILGSCSQKVHSVYFDPWWRKVTRLGCSDLPLFWSIMFCAVDHWPFLQIMIIIKKKLMLPFSFS